MSKHLIKIVIVLLLFSMAGCNKAKITPTPEETEGPIAAITQPSLLDTAVPTAVPTTAATDSPVNAPTALVITHLAAPGEPIYKNDQKVSDCNTGERVRLGATTLIGEGCDLWDEQKLERPAVAVNGPFLASLDITSAWMGTNQQWLFGKLALYETDPAKLPADLTAAFEIDIDLDSRGDYLILARNIRSTTWTTDDVQVWQDVDGQVGGGKPHEPDTATGNGYEALLFDAGVAADPDLAWVRLNTSKGIAIEFAFKSSLVPANQVFAWWGWTFGESPDPAKMEVVDLLQNTTSWKMDNTCGWIFNAKPTSLQINICPFAYPTAVPTITPTPEVVGCVQQSDSWCQAQHPTDPPGSWYWDSASCSCKPWN